MRFFKINNGLIKEMSYDDSSKKSELIEQADWIDAHEISEDERGLLSSLLNIELPGSDDVEEIEASARYFVDQAGLHVHSLFLSPTEGRHTTVNVASILQKNRLITIREGSIADFRLLRLRARRGQVSSNDVQSLFITILEQKVENHADTVEDIHHQLEKISYTVLEDEDADWEDCISRLARLEDSNGKIRLCLMDTQRVISFLLRHLKSTPEQLETLREIVRDIETLMSHTTFLFEKINFLMDSTQGFINIEQNKIIKIFSIASVVFLPPTVIASVYGMNFEIMPELNWDFGYPFAILLMITSGFAPYFYFRRKGWL
ncbi:MULTISPECIES: magnesium/cobalt transporter CorA [Vibrio]|uniref:Magnesium transport protein CorA n=1 Tax=Vibrio casei TaxID=673372 RepID=A0A368LPR8_9VIBR|nr:MULTISPECIES: magnesium/cobalt transporter CorA [Vibrio]RCS73867.1 magnesium and cobalt transport protein CorA [Vibrio casei]SJN31544.1 Magnesium and cobalt transport protein CorA [Vibrio casei]HBV77230.1 magnesium and cobalt transport protein CorA [Vibrio sp.]